MAHSQRTHDAMVTCLLRQNDVTKHYYVMCPLGYMHVYSQYIHPQEEKSPHIVLQLKPYKYPLDTCNSNVIITSKGRCNVETTLRRLFDIIMTLLLRHVWLDASLLIYTGDPNLIITFSANALGHQHTKDDR